MNHLLGRGGLLQQLLQHIQLRVIQLGEVDAVLVGVSTLPVTS